MPAIFKAVFLDIDGTLIRPSVGGDENNFTLQFAQELQQWFSEWITQQGCFSQLPPFWQDAVQGQHQLDWGRVATGIDRLEDAVTHAGADLSSFQDGLAQWMGRRYREIEGATELLNVVRRDGRKLYLATANTSTIALAKLRGTGLDYSRFDGTCGGLEVVPRGKSSPDFFRCLAQQAGFAPEEILHIGNSPQDDAAFALEAGLGFCLLLYPGGVIPPLKDRTLDHQRLRVCSTLHEVSQWVQCLSEK